MSETVSLSEPVFHRVAVLKGGSGSEREVSLKSGSAVAQALRDAGMDVLEMDVRESSFSIPESVEAVFPVLHGSMGEDGQVQYRLEELGLPYVGSRSWEMPRSFDKEITHALLEHAGLRMPDWEMTGPEEDITFSAPLVIKAPRQGSSLGLAVVKKPEDIEGGLKLVRKYDKRVLVEKFIEGTECTVGFVGNEALPVIQIKPESGMYDYEAKYQRSDTQYLVPAPYNPETTRCIVTLAEQAYALLGGRHLGRVDFRVDAEGTPYILELNPIPGFTSTSLLPKAAAAVGIDFKSLCLRIMNMAEPG